MTRLAIYPGSFDPITNGHVDIISRASRIFDRLLVAVAANSSKSGLFTYQERVELIRSVVGNIANVEAVTFEGLLVDFARQSGATAIVRGIRAVTDFDYEYAMFQMNQEVFPAAETVFLLASGEFSYLSSTIVKEFARYGRSVENFCPPSVSAALLKKFGHGEAQI
ncbi:MAG: pantetheine-phosphate adenylyltransferase [Leptospirales bacterium]|nr:pantetheine-phosphate adenylyltransferase [Leptospirales bacterium]